MLVLLAAALSIFLLLVPTSADISNILCDPSNLCPQSTPCCSQYGQCGIGAYCLGGCDPTSSHTLDSCMPAPICSSSDFKFDSLNGFTEDTQYLGNVSSTAWVYSGIPKQYTDGSDQVVLMTLPPGNSSGTLLATSAYVWYGKVSATLKTSHTQGVVTAFILLSDVKDEIDFEFVGYNTSQAQSNFYWEGVTNYTNGRNHSVDDTYNQYHTYEIDWNPDSITWSIDNNVVRTLHRENTYNSTTNSWAFPQTPARVQLSLWPAGSSENAPGTVAWAGGSINWDAPDVQNAGYFYAMVKEVNVQCYDPPQGAKESGNQAYIYDDKVATNDTVEIVSKNTVLKSLLGTGLDPNVAISSGAAPSATAAQVPGADSPGGSGNGANGAQSDGSVGSPTAAGAAPSGSTFHGFCQNGNNCGTSTGVNLNDEKVLQGSMLAVLLAIAALLVI